MYKKYIMCSDFHFYNYLGTKCPRMHLHPKNSKKKPKNLKSLEVGEGGGCIISHCADIESLPEYPLISNPCSIQLPKPII